jgi:hypothetical protein
MVEIRQAEDDLPGNRFLDDPFGHTSGLLCRRHAQHSMLLPLWVETNELDECTGDLLPTDPSELPTCDLLRWWDVNLGPHNNKKANAPQRSVRCKLRLVLSCGLPEVDVWKNTSPFDTNCIEF